MDGDGERIRRDIMTVVERAIESVEPEHAVLRAARAVDGSLEACGKTIDLSLNGRIVVVGAGKASASMARALESILGDRLDGGIVSAGSGGAAMLSRVEAVVAGHPIPDGASVSGARSALSLALDCGKDDLVICALSGGASAMWCLPASGISLEDAIRTTEELLRCGADIHEINAVRKHLSGIKGGRLAAAAHPARLVTFLISDVIGDRVDSIGSGPTVPDTTTFADALAVVKRYGIEDALPVSVMSRLRAGEGEDVPETPKPGEDIFARTDQCIVASNAVSLAAAGEAARRLGYMTHIIDEPIEGEAREAGPGLLGTARELLVRGAVRPPAMILGGGETTVTVCGEGRGGRNQELVLAAAVDLAETDDWAIASVATDGIDGPTDAAGAFADRSTVRRGKERGCEARLFLDNNDSYAFFDAVGDLIRTGPTGTNVMDIQIVAILAGESTAM